MKTNKKEYLFRFNKIMLTLLLICLFIVFYVHSCRYKLKCIDGFNNMVKNESIRGKIIKLRIDKFNHYAAKAEYEGVSTNEMKKPIDEIYLNYEDGLYKHLKIGDSIFKPKNSLIFTIKRTDTTFKYSLSEFCCQKDGSGCDDDQE